MIVDALVGVLHAILAPLFALLPAGSLTTWFPSATSVADSLANKAFIANTFFPLKESADLFATVIEFVVPAVLAYTFANWLYRHIPQFAGFGPGSG